MKSEVEHNKYEAVIGLEIHAELKTASKMFCSCANDPFNAEPNANICPICLGFPGTLPVPNKRAVELTLQAGRALHCIPPKESKYDRKNYFYPDLPKGYQISQYDLPFMQSGHFTLAGGKKIRIRRIHLEEDTGKLVHREGKDASLVDYNRAGVPLIELVTEPDITSPHEAVVFAKELQLILRYLGASHADMERGEMRVEANVSVRRAIERTSARDKTRQLVNSSTRELGTKVEIKNLNSFKSVEKAIAFELSRQIEIIKNGGKIIQETRGWNEDKEKTFPQRTKEEAEDYRYFPEPDIPPLAVADWELQETESPDEYRGRLTKMGLVGQDVQVLVSDQILGKLFEDVVAKSGLPPKIVANWIVNKVVVLSGGIPSIDAESLSKLLHAVQSGTLTVSKANETLRTARELYIHQKPRPDIAKLVEEILATSGQVISDQRNLTAIIKEVMKENPSAVQDVKSGKSQAFDFLVGQVMAKTKGQADPKVVNQLLRTKLA